MSAVGERTNMSEPRYFDHEVEYIGTSLANTSEFIDLGLKWRFGYSLDAQFSFSQFPMTTNIYPLIGTFYDNTGSSGTYDKGTGFSLRYDIRSVFPRNATATLNLPYSSTSIKTINMYNQTTTQISVEIRKDLAKVNSSQITFDPIPNDGNSSDISIRLFAQPTYYSIPNNYYFAKDTRVHFVKLHDYDGQLIMDLVPVRKEGIGYLFDRVTHKLFGNSGSGKLVIGPDAGGSI